MLFLTFVAFYLVARALTGHSASVQSLDFHPHGNFIASGSVDATVKVTIRS